MKKIATMLAIAAVVLSGVSCTSESARTNSGKGGKYVDFQIGETNSLETKSNASANVISEEQVAKISLSENPEKQDLFLVETVSDLDDYLYTENAVDTKGTPVYTQNFASLYKNIGGVAKKYTDTNTAPEDFTHTPDEFGLMEENPLRYRYDFGEKNADWPKGQNMLFYLSAPNWDEISASAVSNITYGYTVSTIKSKNDELAYNGTIAFDFITPKEAENQVDYLFTSKSLSYEDYHQMENSTPLVLFYHALAGVKFKTAKAGDQITVITKIEISNISSTGHCVVTPTYDAEGYSEQNSNATPQVTKSNGCVAWTGVATPISFSISGLTADNVVSATSANNFPDSFQGHNSDATQNTLGQDNLNDASFTKTFFFVPQTTPSESKITVYYDIYAKGSTTKLGSYSREVSFAGQNWQAGKLYTYTLSPNHVAVTVTDNMDTAAKVKSGVVIKNTGNADAYYRVALVGNWYDTHSPAQIVDMWHQSSTEGTFMTNSAAGKNTTDWEQASDGFYYYKYIVKAGETLKHPLFDTFTVGTALGNLGTSAHLELDILVQAIDAAKINDSKYGDCGWYKGAFTATYDN